MRKQIEIKVAKDDRVPEDFQLIVRKWVREFCKAPPFQRVLRKDLQAAVFGMLDHLYLSINDADTGDEDYERWVRNWAMLCVPEPRKIVGNKLKIGWACLNRSSYGVTTGLSISGVPIHLSLHALARMADRSGSAGIKLTHAACYDLVARLGVGVASKLTTKFEIVTTERGQRLVASWERWLRGTTYQGVEYIQDRMVDYVEPNIGKQAWVLVGYFPLVELDDVWLAKTFLLPGMDGTPQWDWRDKHRSPLDLKNLDLEDAYQFHKRSPLVK